MNDLKVTYSEHITEPLLEESRLTLPDRYGHGWECTETGCSSVHIAVQFDRENALPDGNAAFLQWIFYAQTNGIWTEVK